MLRVAACLLLLLTPTGALLAEDGPKAAKPKRVTAAQRDEALTQAIRFLDRAFRKAPATGARRYAAAVAGWAWLLAGDEPAHKLPDRRSAIRRLRKHLLEDARLPHRTWQLAVRAHFFAEGRARGDDTRASRKALARCVKTLEMFQQSNGGWIHGISKHSLRATYPSTILAASHHGLSAVAVGRRALGLDPSSSVQKGRAYFAAAQNTSGTFPYDPSQRDAHVKKQEKKRVSPEDVLPDLVDSGRSAPNHNVARTGGAIFALLCAGAKPGDKVLDAATKALDRDPLALAEGHGSATMSLMFGALTAKLRGKRAWAAFRKAFFPRILKRQRKDGSIGCICTGRHKGTTCDDKPVPPHYVGEDGVYVTALLSMVLMLDRGTPRAAVP